jgi:hypothetical protein
MAAIIAPAWHGPCTAQRQPIAQEVGMRLAIASLAVLGLAAPVFAQQSGSVALDATTAYGRTFGAGFYVSDHLSLRPSLGFAYSGVEGAAFNIGSEVRWDFHNDSRFTPYTAASFNYMRSPYLTSFNSSGLALLSDRSNIARYGAGLGVRTRINDRLSVIADGRMMNSAVRDVTGTGTLYRQRAVDSGAHFEGALGLSFLLK